MDGNTFLSTVFLTAAVFAALVSSVANIIISLINNHRLKKIEKRKQMDEISKYRYTHLYELLQNWKSFETKTEAETVGKIISHKRLYLFLDDVKRYDLARPLLDEVYIKPLELQKAECIKLVEKLAMAEAPDSEYFKEFSVIEKHYYTDSKTFSEMLKDAIYSQLQTLLVQND